MESATLVRWLAGLAATLIAAAVIGMSGIIWTMNTKVAVLETKVEALQNHCEMHRSEP